MEAVSKVGTSLYLPFTTGRPWMHRDERAVVGCGLACGQDLGGEPADGDPQGQL